MTTYAANDNGGQEFQAVPVTHIGIAPIGDKPADIPAAWRTLDTEYTATGLPVAFLPTRLEYERLQRELSEKMDYLKQQSITIARLADDLEAARATIAKQAQALAEAQADIDDLRGQMDNLKREKYYVE